MKNLIQLIILLVTVTIAPCFAKATLADEDGTETILDTRSVQPEHTLAAGSDAQFDKRLPPVLPGEEVRDGEHKMKIWSTSGPVPVGPAPRPFDAPSVGQATPEANDSLPSNVDVIIDRR